MRGDLPAAFEALGALLLGLVIGSFLNVVAHRLPRGESIVRPRSRCPGCGDLIPWYLNVPLVSWIALGGRCRACRAPIPLRYPALELASGLALVAVWWRFGVGPEAATLGLFSLALVVLFVIDLEHQLLPNRITLPGTVVGIALAGPNPWVDLVESIGGAAVGFGALWAVREGYYRLRGQDGLGGGDPKFAALIGAFLGIKGMVLVVLLASLGGVLVALVLVAARRANMQTALPFGCFLAPAAFLVALLGADGMWAAWQALVLGLVWGEGVGVMQGSP